MKIFSLNKSILAETIFAGYNISGEHDNQLTFDIFSDGEILPIFRQSIRGENICVICDGNTPNDMMRLFLTLDASKRSGSKSMTVIYPYKFTPIGNRLFLSILQSVGVTSLQSTEVDNNTIKGFYNTTLAITPDKNILTEHINIFDPKQEIEGDLYYSINKSPLSKKLFDLTPTYNDTDMYLTISESEGRYYPMFTNNVKGRDVYLLADGHKSVDIIKLLTTIDLAQRSGAKSITVIYPYAPYSRQDKNDHVRSSIGAKLLADILQVAGMTRMITIELHAGSIQGFYDVPIIELKGNRIFTDYLKSLGLTDICGCAPDHGASKRNADLCKSFPGATSAVIDKRRLKPNEIHSMLLLGDVAGKNVFMADDLVDTLGTGALASKLIMSKGALSCRGAMPHALLTGLALGNLYDSELTELLVSDTILGIEEKVAEYDKLCSDIERLGTVTLSIIDFSGNTKTLTLTRKDKDKIPKLTVISCAMLTAKTLDRLTKNESINELNLA